MIRSGIVRWQGDPVGDVDSLDEFIARRTARFGTPPRVNLDTREAGLAAGGRYVIGVIEVRSASGAIRSTTRAQTKDGRRILIDEVNVKSPGPRPGLSFGASGFRAARLEMTEPADDGVAGCRL